MAAKKRVTFRNMEAGRANWAVFLDGAAVIVGLEESDVKDYARDVSEFVGIEK
jgi:hypothetical protein